MTQGAVIFAFNNQKIDYVALAAWNAARVRRHLGIPVALITDHETKHDGQFDQVIRCATPQGSGQRNFHDTGPVEWHNTNRADVYELTPWDRTLLLDADYVVASPVLRTVLDTDQEFLSYRWAYDVTMQDDFSTMNFFGDYYMPMWWATVIVFDQCSRSKLIFDSMQMTKENWRHYRHLYANRNSLYRNDHALSIALGIECGHSMEIAGIPWSMATVLPHHQIRAIQEDEFRIEYQDVQGTARYIEVQGQDLHVMAKTQLGAIVDGDA